ncbi:hypothetical protein [Corynebacterium frankenforstense]|uniref:hypothetical protein n=1 Tax=Corynebacterium frankenforstense TaxID=1230998 RepID=UPI000951FBBC|nr:hypothetical protein [Corynebacterium frankenforstense]
MSAPHAAAARRPRYLRAELIRARGSALARLPLLGLLLGAITAFFGPLSAPPGADAATVLNWQGLYLTGMAAPLVGLFAAVAESRERTARAGGTAWRSVSVHRQRAARLAVVWLAVAAFHVLNFGVTFLAAALLGMARAWLVAAVGAAALLGALGVAGLAAALARRRGTVAVLVAGVIWQAAGIAVAAPWWWALPPTWPLRLVLPLLGVQFNLLPLEPGSPLAAQTPWWPAALCCLLVLLGAAAAVLVPPRERRPRPIADAPPGSAGAVPPAVRRGADFRDAGTVAERPADAFVHGESGHPGPGSEPGARHAPGVAPAAQEPMVQVVPRPALSAAGSAAAALRATARVAATPAVLVAVGLSVLALAATAAVYDASYVRGLFVFAVLPLGAGVLPVLVWPALAGAWPLARVENPRVPVALVAWIFLVVAGMCLVAAVAVAAAGVGEGVDPAAAGAALVRWAAVACLSGCVLAAVALALTVRLGTAWAVAAAVVWTVVSATLGGDVLAQTVLWLPALPSWAQTADIAARFIAVAALGLPLLAAATWAARRALLSVRQ